VPRYTDGRTSKHSMKSAPIATNETARLQALRALNMLDTPIEADFDDIVELAASICDVPMCAINLIEDTRQWFKSEKGLGVREMPVDISICAHALLQQDFMEVPDLTKDTRFDGNPLVARDKGLRFYAGALLTTQEGFAIGTLCVLDRRPRELTAPQKKTLEMLANIVMGQIYLRNALRDSEQSKLLIQKARDEEVQREARHRLILNSALDYAIIGTDLAGNITSWNYGAERILGLTEAEAIGSSLYRIYTALDRENGVPESEMRRSHEKGRGPDDRWHVREDGTRFIANGEMMPLLDGGDIPLGFVKIFRDVTETRSNEKRFRDTEDHINFAFEAAENLGTWDFDVATKVVTLDARLRKMHLLAASNAGQGMTFDDYLLCVKETDRRRLSDAIDSALGLGGKFSEDYSVISASGEERWLSTRGHVYLDKQGKPFRFPAVVVDITERLKAENALRDSEAYIKLLLDSTAEGFYAIDRNGVTTLCNAAFTRMLGFDSEEQALGLKLHDLIHHSHPDGTHYDVHDCPIYKCGATGAAAHVEDEFFYARDGRKVPVEYRAVPIYKEGVLQGAICTFSDVTARRKAEAALKQLNENLESEVAQRTAERDRVWTTSRDLIAVGRVSTGKWISANPAWEQLLGWQQFEVADSFLSLFEVADDRGTTLANIVKSGADSDFGTFENRYAVRGGGEKRISWAFTKADDEFYVVGRDVTAEWEAAKALREVEETLHQAQKMQAVGQLTGGVAHDFNNMLQGVMGPLELIKRYVAMNRFDSLEKFANMALSSAQKAAALTHRLLAFSRRQPLDPKPIEVNELARSLEDLIRRTCGETVSVRLDLDARTCETLCDGNQLESALLNLAINSRDAMHEGGQLTIETSHVMVDALFAKTHPGVRPGPFVCIAVKDTGVGMSDDVLRQAFEPFFTTKPLGQGTGLGLSMVYGFTGQSGGFTNISSRPGAGTTIRLFLPEIPIATGDELVSTDDLQAESVMVAGEVILVIEDEDTVRGLLIEIFTDAGYHVLDAVDGPSGLALLESNIRIDMLVTDVGLPGMNGRQVAEAARMRRTHLPVLFLTGYAEIAAAAAEGISGGDGVQMITKPFTVDGVLNRVQGMLAHT